MKPAYRIADEPIPGRLASWVVNPVFPLLAGMLGGFAVGAAWLIVNGAGMGSASQRKEAAVIAGATVALIGAVAALLYAVPDGTPRTVVKLCLLGVQLIKLTALYVVNGLQSRSFALHQYFGGPVRNGIPLLVLAALARRVWIEPLPLLAALVVG